MEHQTTLKGALHFSGVGLHTGKVVNLTVLPAAENQGYLFKRIDLPGHPIIPASLQYVNYTVRGTVLEKEGVKVSTTEHLLAALYGMQIDNVLIELDGPEVPILDGSALLYVEAIEKVGFVEQQAKREYFELNENIKFEIPEKGIEFLAVPDPEFRVTVMVDYNSHVLGTQHAQMMNIRDFKKEIAHCRTFVFLRELQQLADLGLIKGGDLDNAVVLVDKENVSKEELQILAKKLGRAEDLSINYKGMGLLNSSDLRELNEPARHKLLDIIGDFALIGKPIRAHILAARPGHYGNTEFGKILLEQAKKQARNYKKFNLSSKVVYDINAIKKLLPHRYPFLLVDKIIHLSDENIVGVKNISINEPFFEGHFPEEPVMPGVLQLEAMAQTAGILMLSKITGDKSEYSTYFLSIDQVKFRQKVIPGDVLVLDIQFIEPIRRGIAKVSGKAYVNSQLVSEAILMAQLVHNKQ